MSERPTTGRPSVDRMDAVLRLAQPPARRFVPGVLVGVLGAASAVALLASSAWLIARAAEQPSIIYLSAAVVGVRAFALARAAFRYLERLVTHDAALRQLTRVRVQLLERLVPLAPDGMDRIGRGDLLSRFAQDVDGLQDLPLRVRQPVLVALVTAVGSVAGVALLSAGAAIALAACLLIAFAAGTVLHGVVSARAERRISPLRGAVAGELLDTVSSLDTLIAYDAVEERLDRIAVADRRLRAAELRSVVGAGLATAVVTIASGAAVLSALLVGVPQVFSGALDGPELAVIVLVPLAVFEVCTVLPAAVSSRRRVLASAGRVAAAVPDVVPPEIPVDAANARRVEPAAVPPRLSLRGVTAHWPDGGGSIGPLDLDVAPGERLLVVGESGAGKTTLAHVLVRLLSYDGSLLIGADEARALAQDDVRRVVGLCEQRPWIFDATLRENLLFARDSATDADLLAVLDRVGLASWAQGRDGLDTALGEGGSLVSGGQAQRIALARALLADFPVLVLDEPTANVDADRADDLLRDLLEATAGDARSVVLISHGRVPGDLVDRLVRLREGLVVA